MIANSVRFINIGIHGANLGSRFLFIFFLAKFLDPAMVGYYGIFTATVGYCLYFVGLDFYTYVSREILKTNSAERGRLLKGQAALACALYVILLPVGILFLGRSGWPGHLVWWFFPILVLEHLNQELSRLLVALSEQLTASVIMFVRQGSWSLVIIILMAIEVSARELDLVMLLWVLGGLSAASLGIRKIKKLKLGGWARSIDWKWVKKGIFVSAAFLSATLALRGVQTFDRYWLEALGGMEMVGAYVLLMGVASTLLVFLDASIFSFTYPSLIQHHHKGECIEARRKVNRLFFQTLGVSLVFSLVSWLLLPYLLDWIGNPVYKRNIGLYPWLLSAMVINSLGMIPHYALYARQTDRAIIYSHLASLLVFGLVTWVFSYRFGGLSVAIGLNAAFAIILLWKTYAYWLVANKESDLKCLSLQP